MRKALSWVVLGEQGLRPVWGIILFAATIAELGASSHFVMGRALAASGPLPPKFLATQATISASIVLAATFLLKALEGRPWRFYGLGRGNIPLFLVVGWCTGIVTIAAASAGLFISGRFGVDGLALHGKAILF